MTTYKFDLVISDSSSHLSTILSDLWAGVGHKAIGLHLTYISNQFFPTKYSFIWFQRGRGTGKSSI